LGTGEGIILTTPHHVVLIDGSPHPQTFLRRLGDALQRRVRRIDLVVVTDTRASNVQGLLAVLGRYPVGQVLDAGAEYPSRTYAAWRSALDARRIPVLALRTGVEVVADHTSVQAIAPDSTCPLPNNCAGMLLIRLPRVTTLLVGAASPQEQREALFRHVSLRAGTVVFTSVAPPDTVFLRAERPAHIRRLPGIALHRARLPDHPSITLAGD
jgi:beta-lactamase superfamily II metal-dependent hydrolase